MRFFPLGESQIAFHIAGSVWHDETPAPAHSPDCPAMIFYDPLPQAGQLRAAMRITGRQFVMGQR